MESITGQINGILGVNDIFKAPARMMEVLSDRAVREAVFVQMIELFRGRLHIDYFHEYFQDEAAERKKRSQDFTPMSVAGILAELTESSGDRTYYEPGGAGTGGLCIAKWDADRKKYPPFPIKPGDAQYLPSMHLYICEELSDRAFPFLVFNMAIRGMNGAAIHCDSLSRDCYGVFFLQNDTDNQDGFSSVNVMPYTKSVADFFKVNFVEEKYAPRIESRLPRFLSEAR